MVEINFRMKGVFYGGFFLIFSGITVWRRGTQSGPRCVQRPLGGHVTSRGQDWTTWAFMWSAFRPTWTDVTQCGNRYSSLPIKTVRKKVQIITPPPELEPGEAKVATLGVLGQHIYRQWKFFYCLKCKILIFFVQFWPKYWMYCSFSTWPFESVYCS